MYLQVGSAEEHELELLTTTHELTDLHEFTEYSVWLVAVNANGMGDPTHEVTARTFSALPSGQPQNVTVEAVSSRVGININKKLLDFKCIEFFTCTKDFVWLSLHITPAFRVHYFKFI